MWRVVQRYQDCLESKPISVKVGIHAASIDMYCGPGMVSYIW